MQHINNEQKAFYTHLTSDISSDLVNGYLPDYFVHDSTCFDLSNPLPDLTKQPMVLFRYILRNGSDILNARSGAVYNEDSAFGKVVEATAERRISALATNGWYGLCLVNKIPYFTAASLKQNTNGDTVALFWLSTRPVYDILKQHLKSVPGPVILSLKTPDTLIVAATQGFSGKISEVIDSSTDKPIRYFHYRTDHDRVRLILDNHQMPGDLCITAVFPVVSQYPATIFLLLFSYLILLTGTILFPVLFKKDLQKQIREVNRVLASISEKDFDTHISKDYTGELGELIHSINKMSQQLKEAYHDLEIRVIRRTSEISMRNAELRKTQREILKQNHELKSAYEALKESREKYEKLIEHLEDEYFFYSVAENGTLLFVSPSVKKILGYTVPVYRDLHNQLYTDNPINVLARERSVNLRLGVSQPKYLKEVYDVNRTPKILEVSEVPVFNEDHQLVSVEGLAHDITERQKAEELIKEQEEKYRMLFTLASDYIFMYELEKKNKKVGNFIEANQYTVDKLGYTLEELRQKTPIDLIAAEIWDDNNDTVNEYMANDKKYERIWESKDGNIIDVEISSHAFKIKNKYVAISVARDISDRKRAEEEIRFVNEELINQKENLEALVDNLTQTQEQLVQSEKMAALGQLIAGIAHEVNTPLGAIKASIGNMIDSLDSALSELPALFQTQSLDNLKLFTQLFELARQKRPELSSREKRQKKRDLTSLLAAEKIPEAELLADMLIYLEIYVTDNELISSLKLPDAVNVVKSARNFISILKNTNTINIAVEKATKVVFALKKYAHRDAGGEKVSTDIIDSIETVLTLYHNQLKQGVDVVRNYEKLPLIKCYQDEISQVWTNLIQNAIQAMHLEGILTISTHIVKDVLWISFKDTGPGIEPDIIDKIFEPFFTTKKQGEGSGLGLDIVKKIVDKHNGTIEVDSKLGEGANFIIKIPVN